MSVSERNVEKCENRNFNRAELAVCILLSLLAAGLHWSFLLNAGALWRDEVGMVHLALLPKFQETWAYLGHESCPLVFPVLVRFWSLIGLGGTDFGLRVLGFFVGLLILGACWFASRTLTRTAPLISLGFLFTNAALIRWGDSLRAYGTGTFLMLLTFALVWRFVQLPSRGRWCMAALAALGSAQCLYQNAFFILAVCLAGGVVCWRRRNGKLALTTLTLGLPAAASYLPYLGIIHEAQGWSVLSQTGFLPERVWQNFSAALAPTASWTKWLWLGFALAGILRLANQLRRPVAGKNCHDLEVELYAGTALMGALLGYFIFLRVAALPTQVWYFLLPVTFVAVCLDGLLANWRLRWKVWKFLLPGLMFSAMYPATLESVQSRQTNIDLVAAYLRQWAGPHDLILVQPWYYGITFDGYYTGTAPWTTLPPLEDYRFHRYDLLKIKMQMSSPIQSVLDKLASTLKEGNRVWLVGAVPLNGKPPPELHPAPDNPWGWLDEPYSEIWAAQAGYLLAAQAKHGAIILFPSKTVSSYENTGLMVVYGQRKKDEP